MQKQEKAHESKNYYMGAGFPSVGPENLGWINKGGCMKKKKVLLLIIVCILILAGCSENQQNSNIISKSSSENLFFFKEGVQSLNYNARFTYLSDVPLPNKVQLLITEKEHFNNGIVYKIKINCDGYFDGIDSWGEDRFNLGYFYVQKDKIYLIRSLDVFDKSTSETDIINEGIIVCQTEEMKDVLEKSEKGWHKSIIVDGNRREYHGYNTLSETGYYERFIWEEDFGLVEYKSGYGAESDNIELYYISD